MKKLLITSLLAMAYCFNMQAQCMDCYAGGHEHPHGPMTPKEIAGSIHGSLNQSYLVQNVCGLNYTQATVLTETRTQPNGFDVGGTGFPTTLSISGLPYYSCASIVKAYLYYGCTFTEATPPSTSATITNPALVVTTDTSTMVGTTTDNICWTGNGSVTYRTDVTSLITGNGNYTINLNGFANADYEVDGVTLIIIYSDPSATYNGSMALYDGDLSNDAGVTENFTANGFTNCSSASNATAFTLMGDVQANVSGGVNTEDYNGSTVTFPNNFWNYCAVTSSLAAGQDSLVYETYMNNTSDCYFIGVAGLYWQNTNCVTCVPVVSTMTLTTASSAASCGSNGSASVSVTGASGPLTYTWSPGGQTTDTATGLASGKYTVYVSDGSSCTADSVTVLYTGMVFTVVPVNAACSNPGSATIIVTGGVAPYTYLWSNGGTSSSVTLTAGIYDVTVTDNGGCSLTDSITISNVSSLYTYVVSGYYYVCPNIPGYVSAVVGNGTPPYTYSWSPGGTTTQTVSNLLPGYYNVTVTDSNGCTASNWGYVDSVNNSIHTSFSTTPYYCPGNGGTATVTAYGGWYPYTYSWSPGGQTTATITGLSAGTYTVDVKDSVGCNVQSIVSVSSSAVSFTVSGYPTSINPGDSTTLTATCSVSATYSWSPASSVAYSNWQRTNAGPSVTTTYTCTITTACGTYTSTVTIHVNCFAVNFIDSSSNCIGMLTATMSGGSYPFTYLWLPGGQTTETVSGLSLGTYTVTVTDSSGCSVTDSATIVNHPFGTFVSTVPYKVCPNIPGAAVVVCTGGTPPFTYLWSNGGTTYVITGLSPGYYSVTVTDTYGCSTTNSGIVDSVFNSINLGFSSTAYYCPSNKGTATVTASGGVVPYTYYWWYNGATTATVTGLTAGSYTVGVEDATGCLVIGSVSVSSMAVSFYVSAYPTLILRYDSTALSAVCSVPATFSWSPAATVAHSTYQNTNAGPWGTTTYTCTAVTACGTYTAAVTVTVECFGINIADSSNACGGELTAIPLAGTPPFTYTWWPGGQTTATITGLSMGTYSVTVEDSAGCIGTQHASVSSYAVSFYITANPDSVILAGDTVILTAYCSVSATYLWSNGATTQSITVNPPVTTTYTCYATTPCGTYTTTITVNVVPCINNYDESICIVTVDTATDRDEIIWGRYNSPPTGSYNVYKENSSFSFSLLVNQPLTDYSDYIDTSSRPWLGPNTYELATEDSCGQSALSAPHTSIFLWDTTSANLNILFWTPYVGFTPVQYYIYRGTSLSNLVKIDSVPNYVLTYRDTLPPPSSVYLIVAENPSGPCIATPHAKPHSPDNGIANSLSNIRKVKNITGITPVTNMLTGLNIYPNPGNGMVTVEYSVNIPMAIGSQSSEIRLSVIDELGQVVYDNTETRNAGNYKEQINLESLASGIYSLRVQTANGIMVKKLIIIQNK